jgi:hypothetical protein
MTECKHLWRSYQRYQRPHKTFLRELEEDGCLIDKCRKCHSIRARYVDDDGCARYLIVREGSK